MQFKNTLQIVQKTLFSRITRNLDNRILKINMILFIMMMTLIPKQTTALFFSSMFSSLYKLYLERGIPFREQQFIGNKPILKEYDFVVIGAGPGGTVVSNRLTEIPEWKVLLLEAGSAESIYSDIPATVSFLQFSEYNWGYKAERTNGSCLAMEDQKCPWPRGKAMGGTSTINYMIYTRGNKRDYNNFAKAGNTGWSYDEILPYFLKSERNKIPEYQNSKYHSKTGYLNVERVPHKTVLLDAFLEAGKELGYRIVDYNEPSEIGFSRIQATMRKGRRYSASKAFIEPIKDRKNLHISIRSHVNKILIDPKTKKAYGVEFEKDGEKRTVLARKEVILSAGALNSPQLLMLSGIGPKDHLEQLNIPVIHDSHVGKNLQEHYVTIGLSFIVNATDVSLREKNLNLATFLEWLNKGKGILTLPGGVEGIAYVNTKYNNNSENYPDMEYIFSAGSLVSDGGDTIRKNFGVTNDFYDKYFSSIDNEDTWTIFPMLLHPKTLGEIKLKNRNPQTAPLFYFDYFKNDTDLKTLVEGVKGVIRLSQTKAFQKLGTKLNPTEFKQCSHHEFQSDEYWQCFVRYFTGTIHHQCGTCKMGPKSDKTAVVDPQLKVNGIENLRIVDASIFPTIPSAHLYAPTLMVGEKASDMIKSDWFDETTNSSRTDTPHK